LLTDQRLAWYLFHEVFLLLKVLLADPFYKNGIKFLNSLKKSYIIADQADVR